MPRLNIVMVEPEIPQNTGNVARTCAATGARLHLVGPMGFTIDDKKLKRAGLDYWKYLDIRYYENWEDFIEKNLFHHEGQTNSFGCKLPRQLLPFIRQGDKGSARGAAHKKSRKVRANTHAGRNTQFKPFKLGCNRGLRGAAAVELPGAQ